MRPIPYRNLLGIVAGTFLLVANDSLIAADLDAAPIAYSTAEPDNVIVALEARIQAKTVDLKPDQEHGYLRAVLTALDVPLSSQLLVMSKTSLQRSRISPKTPRAIYFNDDVTIGYCQRGDVVEIAAADARLGTVFYTLDQDTTKPLRFVRQGESCLMCHASSRNHGFPGHLTRSVAINRTGEMLLSRGSKSVDHATPFSDRWGGWYVTGLSGKQTHQGNQIVGGWPWADRSNPPTGENITDLKPYLTISSYPTPHSDLVALMVLEHQNELQNRMTRANFLTRQALYEQAELNKMFGEPADAPRDSIVRRIHSACEPVVQYLLMCQEAKLEEPISGTSNFTQEFNKRGPWDSKMRSLRTLDLNGRLFRYPLSYLIYSRQLAALPTLAQERIYQRLWEVLSGVDRSELFAHISAEDKVAIREILQETHPGLPASWKK